jgi:hypothetical protein
MTPKIIKAILNNGEVLELGEINPISQEDYKDWIVRLILIFIIMKEKN